MGLKISDIVEDTFGWLKGAADDSADMDVQGVSTDSRAIARGEVFFALRGTKFDGHAFVRSVADRGAAGAVVETTEGIGDLPSDFALIVVKDTTRALGDLAAAVRARHTGPIVAISGSTGKTSTKEMAASILSRSRKVLKTEGNFNNLIGLPLTLLALDETHEAAVVELGISKEGEMERLVDIARPDVAVLTNIGSSHLEGLGSPEGVARAKSPIFATQGVEPVRVVNLDDPFIVELARSIYGAGNGLVGAVTFSLKGEADVRVVETKLLGGLSGSMVTFDVRGERVTVGFASPSEANAVNAAAAIAATLPLGVSLEEITLGLEAFCPLKGRMEVIRAGDITIIDDTYNANPDSVASAIRTLASMNGSGGRKVVILGDMLELGDFTAKAHREAGKRAAEAGAEVVIGIGSNAGEVAEGAVDGGLTVSGVFGFNDKAAVMCVIGDILKEGDTVLVKGSRGSRLEELVANLRSRDVAGKAIL